MKNQTFNEMYQELSDGILNICQEFPKCSQAGLGTAIAHHLTDYTLKYGSTETLKVARQMAKFGMIRNS